jgi:hypothetical protein
MVEWHFFDKVFRRWTVLMIGDFEKLKKDLEDFKFTNMEWIKPSKGMCIELCDENNSAGQRCNIIWMPVYETATLVHEITHLVMHTFDEMGIPISRDNTETFAFYTEFWFNEIQRARRKYPNGRSPAIARQ